MEVHIKTFPSFLANNQKSKETASFLRWLIQWRGAYSSSSLTRKVLAQRLKLQPFLQQL